MCKISVIIPVYNAEDYLERCLDSVCNQTLKDIEIICINDCSTDSSLEIIQRYLKNDKRIKIVDCKINGGESRARNIGIENAIGEYIAFVDNDDAIDVDFYEKLYNKAIETNAEIVKAKVQEITYNGESVYRKTNEDIISTGNKMLFNGDWWSAIYKKDFINKNNLRLLEGYPLGADSLFLYLAMVNSSHLEIIFDTYYNYYRREDSGSSKVLSIDKIKSFIDIIKIIFNDINQRNEEQLNKSGYDTIFSHFFDILASMPILNSSNESKKICAKEVISAYRLYKYDKKVLFEINRDLAKYKKLEVFLINNKEEEIIKSFNKHQMERRFLETQKKMQKDSNIPVFLSSDDNYAPFVATTIASICDNTKSFIEFYVLDGGISNKNREKICDLKKQYHNFSIEFLKIDIDKHFKDFIEIGNFNRTMYTRFLIPYLKPEINKAIYTDVDVIFYDDIKKMWEENLEGYALGAVWEDFFEDSYNIERKNNIELSEKHKYFSSGNLLLDCKQWREKNILQDLLKLYNQYKHKIKWPDQDILNKYFDCNYKLLERKYCFLDICYEYIEKPHFIIRHYTANLKPWKISPTLKTNVFPDTDRFWHYAEKTPFYKELLAQVEVTDKNIMKYRLMNIHKKALKKEIKISIALSSDDNYAPFVATTIASICDNTKSFIDFYILDGGITNENKEKICELKKQFNNFSIKFIEINKEKYFNNFIVTSYITVAAYYRFLLAELFPKLSKILYLDVDIILKGDIVELFNIDLNSYILGAVVDRGNSNFINKLKNNIDLNINSPYFNSGVLLVNLDMWRKNNIAEKLFETEEKYRGKLKCNDQDVLNKIFENNYKILDDKFNSMIYNENILLRHYYGPIKPWNINPSICVGKYGEYCLFWDIAQKTPFYDELIKKCKYNALPQLKLQELLQRKEKEKNHA